MASLTTPPAPDGDHGYLRSHYEPQGRWGHCSALIDGKVFMWGGRCGAAGTPDDHSSFVDIYDPTSQRWTQQKTSGAPPLGVFGAACVGVSPYMYIFAGHDLAGEFYNSIHRLDTRNLVWTEISAVNPQEAPMKKLGATMVSYSDSQLVTIGGYGVLPENSRPNADYIADKKEDEEGLGWTNEMGVFNLSSRTWSWPSTTGGRPPPCANQSFTRVDQSRAVVYGGYQLGKCVPNHVHILDMQSWAWNTVTGGAPGQPWPVARDSHTAVSLHEADGGATGPALLVMWGADENDDTLSDGWIFTVNAQQWRKMMLPDSLRGRSWHTTTLLHTDDTHKQLVACGGVDEIPEDGDPYTWVPVADTTIVEIDCSGPSGDWVVTGIIPSSQLGHPREKDSLPRHVQLTLEEEMRHLTVCEAVMRQKGTLDMTALQCVLNGAPRVGKSTLLSRLVPSSVESSPSHVAASSMDAKSTEGTFTLSTGVAECVIKVTVKEATTIVAKATQPGMVWELLPLDVEAISLLKAIAKASSFQKPSSQPQLLSTADSESTDTSSTSLGSGSATTEDQSTSASGRSKGLHSFFRFGRRVRRSSTSSDAIPILAGLKSPLDIFKEALRSDKWATVEALIEGCIMLYFTDTGGQLVFQELLSALIAGPSVFFLVFKLNDRLDQKYQIEYVQSATKKMKPYVSRFTVKEALLQSLASISSTCSYMSQSGKELVAVKPKVVLIGTHKDLASEEQIQAIQKELKETLKDMEYYREGTLVFASRDEPVVTVNNLSSEGEDTQKIRSIVEQIARHPSFRISTPVPWLVFGHALKLLSCPVLRYEECLSIAEECGIEDKEELDETLWFLHTKLGILRHFQSIPELREVVILDPQLLFDKITQLITSTFVFESDPYVEETFQQKGIFPCRVIEDISSQCGDLLTSAKLVKLLEHLHIIAPIKDETGLVTQYFMPCVLDQASTVATDDPHITNPIEPLLVTFRCGYCPKGMFSALIVYLLSQRSSTTLSWLLMKNGVSRDKVTFSVGREHHTVSLTTHLTHLEVSLEPTSKIECAQWQLKLHEMCESVRKQIEEGIVTVSRTLHYTCDLGFRFSFSCDLPSCPLRKNHPAVCYEPDPCLMVCSKTEADRDMVLTVSQLVWFGHPLPADQMKGHSEDPVSLVDKPQLEKPRLAQLRMLKTAEGQKIQIIKQLAPEWKDFGISLDFDPEGQTLNLIEAKQKLNGPTACCQAMFQHWLAGNGVPASWGTLIELLEDAEQSHLAEQIKRVFNLEC